MGNVYTLEELQKQKEYQRAYYERKQANNEKRKHKLYKKSLEEKHKGFVFDFDGKIVSLEVSTPFRIMKVDKNGNKHTDDKKYQILQNELKRKLNELDKTKKLVIVEPSYVQVFLSSTDNIDAVCEIVKNFVIEKTKEFGKYIKRNKEVGVNFNE